MVEKRRISFVRVMLALLATIILGLIWLAPFRLGDFYRHQDDFSGSVLRGDTSTARENLEKVEYFYGWNKVLDNFWLDGQANKYLFYNAPYHRSALDYLIGNHTKVAEDLKNDNSFWASYLKGNVNWRIAQDMYKHALEIKDKKEMEVAKKVAKELASSTKDQYVEAIKQDDGQTLPPKWNYDLTTDEDALMRALLPKPPRIRIPLGVPPLGVPSPVLGEKPLPPGNSEDLDKKEGLPQPKRGG